MREENRAGGAGHPPYASLWWHGGSPLTAYTSGMRGSSAIAASQSFTARLGSSFTAAGCVRTLAKPGLEPRTGSAPRAHRRTRNM